MEIDLTCECGENMTVSEGDAGATPTCRCGRTVEIPSLDEMRRRAGAPQPKFSPETIVEMLLLAGKLPEENHCVLCGAATLDLIHCRTECTRALIDDGRPPWWVYVFGYLTFGLLGVAVVSASGGEVKELGKNVIFTLPLRVCRSCRPQLASPSAMKTAMHFAPLYRQLLQKYPGAKVDLATQ